MLTELIAANQRQAETNGNGSLSAEEVAELDAEDDEDENGEELEPLEPAAAHDPGAARRYRFRHPTASGKTIAAAGFVEAARTMGVLILTHRRLLVSQFNRELTEEGYGDRLAPAVTRGEQAPRGDLITVQTYAWFARHVKDLERGVYHLVICDEAHTALGEKTSTAIRTLTEPVYIGMTATEQLIAKQVSDVFPASVDDLPLQDAARRGLIAPLRNLRVPPAAAINSVPIVGGDFEERARRGPRPPGPQPGGGEPLPRPLRLHARHRLRGRRRPRLQPRARVPRRGPEGGSGQRPHSTGEARRDPRRLRARGHRHPHQRDAARRGLELSARDRRHASGADREPPGLPAADRPDHAAASAQGGRDRRRLRPEGRDAQRTRDLAAQPARRRLLPRGRPGHAGAETPRAAPRARKLSPAPWLVPVTPDVRRRLAVIAREWQRIDPRYLDEEEQRFWATIAGRQVRFEERVDFAEEADRGADDARRSRSSSSSPAPRRTPTAACG